MADDIEVSYEISRTLREYVVTIVSSDEDAGSVSVEEITAFYGTTIIVDGNVLTIGNSESEAIVKDSTEEYSYAFEGWDLSSRTVLGEMTVTAEFSKTLLAFVYENVWYLVLEDRSTVSAFGYDGEPVSIAVPDLVYCDDMEFVPVSIAEGAFADCTTVTSIEVGETVADIGAGAFDSPFLTSIVVSEENENYSSADGVLYDKDAAVLIRFPASMLSVQIPESVEKIGAGAFRNAGAALKENGEDAYFNYIWFPATVKTIGADAFRGSALECLKFRDGTTTIEAGAFAECGSVSYLLFNYTLETIGDGAFEGFVFIGEDKAEMKLSDAVKGFKFTGDASDSLEIYVPPVNGVIVSGDVKYKITSNEDSKDMSAISLADDSVTELVIPETITYLGFEWSVTSIASSAFAGTAIESVTTSAEIGSNAFKGCKKLESVTLEGATAIGTYAFYGCTALVSVDLGDVTVLGTSAFSGCSSLSTIDLSGVISVGKHAFYNCKALTAADLSSATTIGYGAFSGTNLQDVSFGSGLTDVDSKAFYGYTFKKINGTTKITANAENLKGHTFSGSGKVLIMES